MVLPVDDGSSLPTAATAQPQVPACNQFMTNTHTHLYNPTAAACSALLYLCKPLTLLGMCCHGAATAHLACSTLRPQSTVQCAVRLLQPKAAAVSRCDATQNDTPTRYRVPPRDTGCCPLLLFRASAPAWSKHEAPSPADPAVT